MSANSTNLPATVRAALEKGRDFIRERPRTALIAAAAAVAGVTMLSGFAHYQSRAAAAQRALAAPQTAVAAPGIAAAQKPAPAPAPAPRTAPVAVAPAAPTAPVAAAPASPAPAAPATASTAAVVPVLLSVPPPAGIQPGRVEVTQYAKDQFNGWAQTSRSVTQLRALTVTTPTGASVRTRWDAWVHTSTPTTIAVLRVAGGQVGVSASIDGQRLGPDVSFYPGAAAPQVVQTASIPLAAGWHEVVIDADRNGYARGRGADIEVALGDGVTPPVVPVPYAAPVAPAAAPASAGSVPALAAPTLPKTPAAAPRVEAPTARAAAHSAGGAL